MAAQEQAAISSNQAAEARARISALEVRSPGLNTLWGLIENRDVIE